MSLEVAPSFQAQLMPNVMPISTSDAERACPPHCLPTTRRPRTHSLHAILNVFFYALCQLARLLVVLGLAVGYYLLRNNVHPPLSLVDAVIFSITSFHGEAYILGNWSHCTTR
jgi:ABC-type uncharacterized transport system permease subunit